MKERKEIAANFRGRFSTPVKKIALEAMDSMLESMPVNTVSEDWVFDASLDIAGSTSRAKEEIYRIIKEYLNDDPDLYGIADKIVKEGKDAMFAMDAMDDDYFDENPDAIDMLEVIVKTDGSRPSFMIRNGIPDRNTSPVGTWGEMLDESTDGLKEAIACVGRINVLGKHIGTGFTVHENLIITNRHVLEAITDRAGNIYPGATIDFGYEYMAVKSANLRKLKEVVFSGSNVIQREIDHKNLDLALIKLYPAEDPGIQLPVLLFDVLPDWNYENEVIYTIGYPGEPRQNQYKFSLLEMLFSNTFGYKRLAPGKVIAANDIVAPWTVTHDATTLGGNSGSVILRRKNEMFAAGLHYGGTLMEPKGNWGHMLGATLDTLGKEGRSLRDCLGEYEVKLEA